MSWAACLSGIVRSASVSVRGQVDTCRLERLLWLLPLLLLAPFVDARAGAARLHQRIAHPLLLRMTPGGVAYANWFGACNVHHYWKTIRAVDGARFPASLLPA
jgi:hypothetical protein